MNSEIFPNNKTKELIAVNFPGWEKFHDLLIMTNEKVARTVLGNLIDYCSHNLDRSVAQFTKISNSSSYNPKGISGVSDTILSLGVDLYFTCYENKLFEISHVRDLPFELEHVGPHRLYLRRLA